MSVVGFLFSSFPWPLHTYTYFLDSPEIGPGGLISNTTNSTGTTPDPTSSQAVTSSSSPYTSTSSGGGGPNAAVIGGSVVAGIAVIAVAVVGIFYLRRRHPMRQSATFPVDGESQLKSQPQNEARGLPSQDGTQESLPMHEVSRPTMKLYVRILVPSFRSRVLM